MYIYIYVCIYIVLTLAVLVAHAIPNNIFRNWYIPHKIFLFIAD